MRRRRIVARVTAAGCLVAGCSTNDGREMTPPGAGQSESVAIAPTTVAASVFTLAGGWSEGGEIDARHTCDGEGVSPALTWTGAPEGTSGFAVILTDLDAPEYAHWSVTNIDAAATGLDEGGVDDLAVTAMNSDAHPAYAGPCPPEGSTHRYSMTVYALAEVLEASNGDPAPAMRAEIEAAALASDSSEFTYSR